MTQQFNMFADDMCESPELMQAIIESYLEANPLMKSCAQGLIQLLTSFSNNFCQQNQGCMNTNNNDKSTKKDDNDNDNKESDKDNNCNDDENDSMKRSNENPDKMFQNPQFDSKNQEEIQENEENKKVVNDETLIQDIIMQIINPEIFESSMNQSANTNCDEDNKNDNASNEEKKSENDEKHPNLVLDIFEMFKVLYQLYLQDKNHPNDFFNHLNDALANVINQFFPQFHSLFDLSKQKTNFDPTNFEQFLNCNPFFQMMNHSMNQSSQKQQVDKNENKNFDHKKRAELRRIKSVDSNGIVTLIIRRSIDDKWHEIENEMNSDGETVKSSKETWNNISEDKFDDFKEEWEKLYKIQNENNKH